jgi:RNA polymerase sigma factor (sigma-70 family)
MRRTSGTEREIEGRDSVGLYLDEIARNPLLDAEREVELSKTIEAGLVAERVLHPENFPGEELDAKQRRKIQALGSLATEEELEWLAEEGHKAFEEFTTANLRLVVSIARKYGHGQMPLLDLIQEGNTGLIRAVEKFDYTKGYKFSTYATWWIRQAITRGIAQQARVVRLPVHVVEELNQVGSMRRTLERQLGRDPEPREIATELGMDIDRVVDLIAWGRDHVSLDTPVDEDGDTTLGDLMAQETRPGPDETVLDEDSKARLEALVGTLSPRDADIIRMRYGLLDGRQHKLADIGAKHGVSAERIRQLERTALQSLRRTGGKSWEEFDESSVAPAPTSQHKPQPTPPSARKQKANGKGRPVLSTEDKARLALQILHEFTRLEPFFQTSDGKRLGKYVGGMTMTEIAQEENISYNTVLGSIKFSIDSLRQQGVSA